MSIQIKQTTKHLVMIDPDTGAREDFGAIASRRDIGIYSAWLTYEENRGMWWIVLKAERGRLHKIGYVLERREICWETFLKLDEAEIVKLEAQTKGME